jgi:autophagy-related protein 33
MREKKIGSDDGWVEAEGEVNGEEMRRSMESWMKSQAIRAGVVGLGFVLAVVGIWGDHV